MDPKKEIQITPEKCTGCRICELLCSAGKYDEFNPKRSRIRIVKMERFFVDIPTVCRHCSNPLCLKKCEIGAIEKTQSGKVTIDKEKCTGCGECTAACPFDAVFVDPVENKAIVCDLCQGSPKCVQWCPTEAIAFRSSSADRKKTSSSAKEAKKLLMRWKISLDEWERYYQKKQS